MEIKGQQAIAGEEDRERGREGEEKPHTVHKCTKYRSTEKQIRRGLRLISSGNYKEKTAEVPCDLEDNLQTHLIEPKCALMRSIQIFQALRGQFLNHFEFN